MSLQKDGKDLASEMHDFLVNEIRKAHIQGGIDQIGVIKQIISNLDNPLSREDLNKVLDEYLSVCKNALSEENNKLFS